MRAFPAASTRSDMHATSSMRLTYVINEAGGVAHFLAQLRLMLVRLGNRWSCGRKLEERRSEAHDLSQEAAGLPRGKRRLPRCPRRLFRSLPRRSRTRRQGSDLVRLLSNVPRKPAAGLHEALQLIWFFQTGDSDRVDRSGHQPWPDGPVPPRTLLRSEKLPGADSMPTTCAISLLHSASSSPR